MSTSFPGGLDSYTDPTSTDRLDTVDHAGQHTDINDAMEAVQAKVGADSSAVTSSHDYKLSGVTGSDKAASLTGSETLTNKTLTSPTINVTSDATGDIYYRSSGGAFTRLAIGSNTNILSVSASGIPEWITNPDTADASETIKGVVEIATTAEIDAGTGTGGTGAKLTISPDNLASSAYVKLSEVDTDVQTFTASGTWNKPANAVKVIVEAWGAGGSGGSKTTGSNNRGNGGGGGAYVKHIFDAGDLGSSETVTIGSGGASVSADAGDGNVGGNTTFGSHLTAYGGGGGDGYSGASPNTEGAGGGGGGSLSAGTTGGTSSGLAGSPGAPLYGDGAVGNGAGTTAAGLYSGGGAGSNGNGGGNTVYGGGGGGGSSSGGTTAGTSTFGGNGGAGSDSGAGSAGTQPGGGGGGSDSAASGAGADGQIIVTTFR